MPVPAGEGHPCRELADVRLDALAGSHPHDQLRVGPARRRSVHRRRERAAEACVDVVDPDPELGVAKDLDGAGTAHGQRLPHPPAELHQLGVRHDRPLDRLAAARLEHRPRDRVEAAPLHVAQQVDREVRAAEQALDHHRLVRVADEELHLLAVGRRVDGARARAAARLDDNGVAARVLPGEHGRRARQPVAEQQLMRLVLVERGSRHVGLRDERREAGTGEDLDVQIGERHDRPDVVLAGDAFEERHVVGIVHRRRRHAHVGRVLRRGERVRVRRHDERVAGERADDVVALPDPRQEYG